MTPNTTTATGAFVGAAAVLLGAFAAHGLKDHLDAAALAWWETGVRYHLPHALAVVLCGVLGRGGDRQPRAAAIAFLLGIALFSGSLYVMALTGARWLGAVTPFGGAALVAGWVLLGVHALRAGPRP